ncbi:MAG: hypothetical protein WKG07_48820 [Hymenobacter sp.]
MALLMAQLRAARRDACAPSAPRPPRPGCGRAWPSCAAWLALGLPIGVQMMLEVGAFSMSLLMIGWLGATPQAAHQIAINVASRDVHGGHAALRRRPPSGWATCAAAGDLVGGAAGGLCGLLAGVWVYEPRWGCCWWGCATSCRALQRRPGGGGAGGHAAGSSRPRFRCRMACRWWAWAPCAGLEDVKVPSVVALLAYWARGPTAGLRPGLRAAAGRAGRVAGPAARASRIVAGVLLRRFRRRDGAGRRGRGAVAGGESCRRREVVILGQPAG